MCANKAQRLKSAHRKANPPTPPALKKCSKCGKEKSASEFYSTIDVISGLSSQCRICNSDRTRKTSLQQKYGITIEDYDTLLKEQNSRCAICGTTDPGTCKSKGALKSRFCIDHDHETDEIRGLLCSKCNSGIGFLGDTLERLEAAAAYLRRHDG